MSVFIIIVMVALAVAAAVMMKKENQVGAIACAVLVIVLAVGRTVAPSGSGSASSPGVVSERHIVKTRQVMTGGLAQKLAERYPNSRVVILGTPETKATHRIAVEARDTEDQLAQALRKYGLEVESIPYPQAPVNDDAAPGLPELYVDEELDEELAMELTMQITKAEAKPLKEILRGLQGEADVVILNLPLSTYVAPWHLPAKGKAPHLVLMHYPWWGEVQKALESTVLDAVLMYRPDLYTLVGKRWSGDKAKAFDKGFLLVTQDNPAPQS